MPVLLNNVFHIDISHWNKMIYVYVAYGLNQSAFLAEIIRAAVHSVDIIQTEAGYSIGLTERQTFTRIVVPQAFVVAVPQLETAFVTLFRATALAYMLGIIDVVGKAKSIGVNTHHTIEGYVCAAIIFTFTSIILEQIFKKGQLQYDRR
jgi:L-cystine transport system permease protein